MRGKAGSKMATGKCRTAQAIYEKLLSNKIKSKMIYIIAFMFGWWLGQLPMALLLTAIVGIYQFVVE